MKWIALFSLLLTMQQSQAAQKKDFKKRNPSSLSACEVFIEKKIKAVAKAAGLKEEIGFEILENKESVGKDMMENPLTKYSTSMFFVDDGYITGSGATVIVRPEGKKCEIYNISVQIAQ